MKPSQGKLIIDDCKRRGWVQDGDIVYTPAQAAALNIKPAKAKRRPKAKRTGWVDDELNIRNRDKHSDVFDMLVKLELGLIVWNEFYFTLEKQYRMDKAIPLGPAGEVLKIAVEIEGGIWAKGNSGHSSGTGIARDMDKSTIANVNGWTLIRCTPTEIKDKPGKIIELIRKAVSQISGKNIHVI